ncbi:hypothetical protein HNV12_02705 [Methanococcoides sp. SA1]|nr:hypothetical protein [Methanococcoides sp. SA1]
MEKAQIYAAYFPTKNFYGLEIPCQTLLGKGKSPEKAIYNILFSQSFHKNRSIEARRKLALNARRNVLREKQANEIVLNLEDIISHNLQKEKTLKYVPMELANELLSRGMVQTKSEAAHFGQKIFNQYQTSYGN